MAKQLRIVIAEDEEDHRVLLLKALQKTGHVVVGTAATGLALTQLCESERPDLVVTDIRMPDMDGLEAAKEIYKSTPVPIIVVTSHHDPVFIERAQQQHILSFLVKPVTEANLAPAIAIALRRFEEFEALRQDNATLTQALEDRKIIEQAKGLLMKQANIDETVAFKRLQKLARDQRKKLAEVAQMVVSAAALLQPETN